MDVEILIKVAKERRRVWNTSGDDTKEQDSKELAALIFQIETLMAGRIRAIAEAKELHKAKMKSKSKYTREIDKFSLVDFYDTPADIAAQKAFVRAKKRVMDIMEKPE